MLALKFKHGLLLEKGQNYEGNNSNIGIHKKEFIL